MTVSALEQLQWERSSRGLRQILETGAQAAVRKQAVLYAEKNMRLYVNFSTAFLAVVNVLRGFLFFAPRSSK